MTPQEVIKRFMAGLNANSYSYSAANGKKMLDDAVQASSDFANVQAVINQMLTDRDTAEREAIKYVLGDKYDSSYDGKQLSQISLPTMTWNEVKDKTAFGFDDNYGNHFYENGNITLANIIKENTAKIFLQKYCGIQLNTNYVVDPSSGYGLDGLSVNGEFISNKSLETPNVDTGAITGSDANITLTAGDVVNGTTLTAENLSALATKHGSAAKLTGDTLVIGTGVEKTDRSVVPENGDMYLFTATGNAKNINTGSNGWVVNATSGNDTITTGGRDSVNAGSGSDKIKIGADEATVTTGNGSDTVEVAANVNSVTVTDLNSSDTITISGTFEVGNAKLENSMLVVTDKTGTRKIKFSDLANAAQAKIGAQTISQWLSNAGFNVNSLSNGDIADFDAAGVIEIPADGRVAVDSDYKPTPLDIGNADSVEQTQTVSSATNINLDDVTITSGTVKSGSSTVGTVSTVTPAVTNFTVRGLTVHVGDGTASSYNQLTAGQKTMVAALFKWWADECLEINEDSYDLGFTSDSVKYTDITLSFENLGGNTLALVNYRYSTYGDVTNVTELNLKISTAYYSDFSAEDKDGISTVDGAGFLDRTLAHEFTHAVMFANNPVAGNLPQFIKEGMAELTHGIDDERGNLIFKLGYDANELTSALDVNNTSTGKAECYAGGYMFLRYLAKQAALQSLNLSATDTSAITLTEGNDTYDNTVDGATILAIDGGDGNDSIYNYDVSNVTINGGASDDYIYNNGSNVTINGGAGNDEIINNGDSIKINGGAGNDSIENGGSNVSIDGGDGNDSIYNCDCATVTINGGVGDDYIYNNISNVTINGGDGNDSIENDGSEVSIDGGAGDDSIYNSYVSNVTINGGKGNDRISLGSYAENNLIEYTAGDGNDIVYGFNETSTLKIGGGTGTYSTQQSGTDLVVTVGDGSVKLVGAATLSTVNISGTDKTPAEENPLLITLTEGNDSYNNTVDGVVLLALAGGDSVTNSGANVTINADAGNDRITNDGANVSIDLGAGNDKIQNSGNNVTINGGYDNDSITNSGTNVSIDAGYGDDTISNSSDSVTINGGAGKDRITNTTGDSVTIDGGAGNDNITNGKYNSTVTAVTIDAGDGDDTIDNYFATATSINAGTGNDSIENRSDHVTIDAGDGDDSISNSGADVTINGGLGNDLINLYNTSKNNLIEYAVGDGDDTIWFLDGDDTLKIGGGTGTYSTTKSGNDIIVTVGDNSILLKEVATVDSVNIVVDKPTGVTVNNSLDAKLIQGSSFDDSIYNSGATVTIDAGDGFDTITNVSGESSSISAGDGDDSILNGQEYVPSSSDEVTIDAGAGNDTITNYAVNVVINAGTGDDSIFTRGNYTTIDAGDGNDSIDNLAIAASINGGTGDDTINNYGLTSSISAGDGDDKITNTALNVSIDAGDGNDSINSSNKNVTILGGSGNDSIVLTGDGMSSKITGGDGDDYISLIDGSNIVFDSAGNDTVYGFGETDTFKVGDGTGTYSKATVDNDILVTVGDNSILLKGAATLDAVNISGEDETPAAYNWTLTDDGAKYKNLFTLTGLKAGVTVDEIEANVSIDGTTVTLSENVLGDEVTITDGYTLALADDVTKSEEIPAAWEIDGTTATFTDEHVTTGYVLDEGKIIHVDATDGETFTLTGLSNTFSSDDVSIEGNKIILSANALDKSNVTLTTENDYSLELGDGCPTVGKTEKSWTLDGTTATYHDAGKTDGYKLTDAKTITYSAATVGDVLLTVNGIVAGFSEKELSDNLTVSGKILTVTHDVVGENFSVDAGYKVVFAAGDYYGSSFTGTAGKDIIEVNGSGLQISLGAGNDTVTASVNGGNVYMFDANGGKDVVKGYNSDDVIKITDGSAVTASVKGSDIIVKAGTATMTLKNAATGTHLNVVDANGNAIVDETVYSDRIVVDDGATLLSAFNSTNFTAEDPVVKVDGSAVTKRFSLTGGDGDNTLIGGTGSNFINGGDGSNELTGGRGNDTFVAGNGTDTITDYGNGTDKISLTADVTDFAIDGDDVIISFGDDKSMTIADGAGKKIYFLQNGKSSTEIFDAGGKMNTAKTSITLNASTDNYTAASTIITINGSLTEGVNIVGNVKANKIFGSDYDDTLNGGTKNATLTGGDGNDIFVYETGKIVISDYVSGDDRISLGASPTAESLKSNGDVFLKFGSDSLTIKKVGDTSNGRTITFTGEDGDDTTKTYFSEKIVGDDGVTLTSSFAGNFTADGKVDASSNTKKITLTGGENDDTLIGGKGTNVLNGNAGDDILIGNSGADTFVYSSGDDTITDYGNGSDKISLTSAIADFTIDNDDVIIHFGDGSLTISDAANSAISFVETTNGKVTTNVNVFAENGIFNKLKTAVTLKADASSYTAPTNVISIDGGLATGDVEIIGNSKANKIYAGDNGSTIDGGAGNDSLWGSDGSDTFIYGGGKDVIYGFGDGDALNFNGDFTASVKGNTISFKVGSTANAVTLKDFTAEEFIVNGYEYAISGSNFVKK